MSNEIQFSFLTYLAAIKIPGQCSARASVNDNTSQNDKMFEISKVLYLTKSQLAHFTSAFFAIKRDNRFFLCYKLYNNSVYEQKLISSVLASFFCILHTTVLQNSYCLRNCAKKTSSIF